MGDMNEEKVLGRLIAEGYVSASELLALEDHIADGLSPAYGPRLDSLIQKGRITPDLIQQIIEDLELERLQGKTRERFDFGATVAEQSPSTQVPISESSPSEEEPFGELSYEDSRAFSDSAADSDFTPTGEISREEIEAGIGQGTPVPSGAPPASSSAAHAAVTAARARPSSTTKPSSKLRISQELIAKHLKDVEPMKDLPVNDWDRYFFTSFLGEGGMGKVYQAYDPYLRRYVALKFIRSDDAELSRRFIQEAQAQAKVEHKNVCKIYEVGEVQDKLYIAMQFIEGGTLSKAKKEMPLDQKIRVMRDVCEGVHAAHRNGLIHRDLKPANIMVEKTEEGPVPYVMDFGLAKEMEASGMTQQGVVMGTPWYMAPEQAKGDVSKLDRRSDVYSLGATFYETVVGKTPFQGASGLEVLMKVIQEDPVTLRQHDPTVPPDLETIIMKCLEKEPQRRYDSARELAEDFQHYLNDEPILARRASLSYRIGKKAKKHKALVAVGSVAAVIVIWILSVLAQTKINALKQAGLATQFGQEVKEVESVLRIAYMLPTHAVDADGLVDQQIKEVKATMNKVGKIGRGPGNYALGRGEMAKEYHYAALLRFQESWGDNFRTPDVAFALGRSLGEVGEVLRTRAMRDSNRANREQRLDDINKNYFQQAVKFIDLGRESKTESKDYVLALRAYYDKDTRCNTKDPKGALQYAKLAFEKNNWLYEAKKLEGDVYRASAVGKKDKGDYEGALTDYKKAEEAYLQTVSMARSDKVGYEGLCNVWNEILVLDVYRGNNAEASFKSAIESCNKAVAVNPKSTKGYDGLSDAYLRYANYLFDHGEDPEEPLTKAIETAQTGLRIDSTREDVPLTVGGRYMSLATALWLRGLIELYNGEDPTPMLKDSLARFKTAVEKDPINAEIYLNMATAYTTLSQYQMNVGQNPQQALDEAVGNFKKSIELLPLPEAYGNLGKLYWQQALSEMQGGRDPSKTLKSAADSLQKSLQLDPSYANAYDDLGIAYWIQETYEANHGKDPSASFEKAVASYQNSLKANPDNADAYNNMGEAYRCKGRFLLFSGGDPQKDFDQAIAQYNKALAINPGHPDAFSNMGNVYTALGELLIARNANPAAFVTTGVDSIKKAIAIDDQFVDYPVNLAEAYLVSARFKLMGNSSPEKDAQLAIDAAQKSLEINPDSADAFLRIGQAERLRAEWFVKSGKPVEDSLQKAKEALENAQKRNPDDAGIVLATAKLNATAWPDAARIQQGITLADKALSLNSRLVEATAVKGKLLVLQAQAETDPLKQMEVAGRALRELQSAINENQNLRREYQPDLDLAAKLSGPKQE